MKPYLVLGANGQLGRALVETLSGTGQAVTGLGRSQADLSHPDSLRLPLADATAVINCAAYTNVDQAEQEEELATRINGDAVGRLAELCHDAKVPLLHFSTDYVFDGRSTEPYRVDQVRSPINAYGRSKARGEQLLEGSGADYLLVRTSWVYAPWGQNFLRTMARLMNEHPLLKVVDDQRGRPTHVKGLAARSLALLDRGARGTFHITDGGQCSWFGFARAIADALSTECAIEPCTTADFPRPAPRPAYSVLDTSAADEALGPPTHYRDWVSKTVAQL